MFEKYAILDAVVHTFEKLPEFNWKIRPPTTKDEIALARYLMGGTFVVVDEQKVPVPHANIEIALFEVSTLFGGTNIPKGENDPTPVLADNASVAEITAFLESLPAPVVMEIWTALGKAVPGWGPKTPAGEAPKN